MNLPVSHASKDIRASKGEIDIPFARPLLGEEEREAVTRVLSGHVLTHGPNTEKFEERFAELIGVSEAVAVSSCTAALHLSLLGHGIEAGDDVIVPAMTHVATVHAVEHCGARPVFADVSRSTGNIGPAHLEAAITPRTKAIVVVHYLGENGGDKLVHGSGGISQPRAE